MGVYYHGIFFSVCFDNELLICYDMVWYGMVYGMVWYMVWYGMVYGMV